MLFISAFYYATTTTAEYGCSSHQLRATVHTWPCCSCYEKQAVHVGWQCWVKREDNTRCGGVRHLQGAMGGETTPWHPTTWTVVHCIQWWDRVFGGYDGMSHHIFRHDLKTFQWKEVQVSDPSSGPQKKQCCGMCPREPAGDLCWVDRQGEDR